MTANASPQQQPHITDHTDLASEHRAVWLFQANPAVYNLREELQHMTVGDEDDWSVTRYRDAYQVGDTVLLWQGGAEAGIYAIGELTDRVRERPTAAFWPDREQRPPSELAVPFRYTRILETPILKAELQRHPILHELQILRAPQGTNFKVTPVQWHAVQQLIEAPSMPNIWIEKTKVSGVNHREAGAYALGHAVWSPVRSGSGGDIYRFMREVQPGDVVLHLTDNTAFTGVSRVASPAEPFDGVPGSPWEGDCYLVQLEDFTPLEPPLPRTTFFAPPFQEPLLQLLDNGVKNLFYNREPSLNQGSYLTPAPPELINVLANAYRSIADAPLFPPGWIQLPEPSGNRSHAHRPPIELVTVAEQTGIPVETLGRWVRALERKGQGILYGPPGTGKTFVAQHLAQYLIAGGVGFTELVQFHPSYSYEDFMVGIRPELVDGQLTYTEQDGRFVAFCERARETTDPCVLIVDEINRANLSQVFGELMYLLEYRDQQVELAGGRPFEVPANVTIIGTMNTADRSIALMDYALRRRFAFFRLDPNYELLARYLGKRDTSSEGLVQVLQEVNAAIDDPNYALGVTFFLRDDLDTSLEDIWHMEVEPYLEEYFFDQPDRAAPFAWDHLAGRIWA